MKDKGMNDELRKAGNYGKLWKNVKKMKKKEEKNQSCDYIHLSKEDINSEKR